ncbi:MAG: hypothetical protein ACK4K7_14350 [Allosphingosinicella sp.]|uniref:hypothetical protein n=1 Tax=Allosphingosinicella sp. TaxID=2823234 RepID=UPI003921C9EA
MELAHDEADIIEQRIQRRNDWMARQRPVCREDYINGQAKLRWCVEFSAFGRWHKVWFQAEVMNFGFDPHWPSWRFGKVSDAEGAESCCRDYGLVLVRNVGFVKAPESVIPSWIWLLLPADLLGFLARFPGSPADHVLNVRAAVLREGEVGVFGVSAASGHDGGDTKVKCASQIVERIAKNGADCPWWGLFEGDFEARLPRLQVNFLRDSVSVAAQPMIDEEVYVSNVKLSAI